MKTASFYDKKGILFIDCTECERGINGSDKDKCSAGWKIKKKNSGYCSLGKIIEKHEPFINKSE